MKIHNGSRCNGISRLAVWIGAGGCVAVLASGCAGADSTQLETDGADPTLTEELEIGALSSPLVGVMSYGNCTSAEEDKLNAAVDILVAITGTQYSGPGPNYGLFEACLASAQLVENVGFTPAQIAHSLRTNTVTAIWCSDLPPNVVAQAQFQYWPHENKEELEFDTGFLASMSPVRVASVIGHELMHNRHFGHADTPLYPLTVPEQVEACILNFAPNSIPFVPRWALQPGRAKDIGVGSDGSVWVIGTDPRGAGSDFGIYQWNGGYWVNVPGGAVRIAVGPDGQPWVLNSADEIYHRENGVFVLKPGRAKDIGVGSDGSVWVIGTNPVGSGSDFGVHLLTGSGWVGIDGGGVRIAVGSNGQPWIVNSVNQIYRRVNGAWQQMPGGAKDIGVAAGSSAWVIGTDNTIHSWNGSTWVRVDGSGVAISVGPSGDPWLLNSADEIFHRIRNVGNP